MLLAAWSLLLFADVLHPVFHEHCGASDDCDVRPLIGVEAPFLTHAVAFDHHETTCPICSSALLKYCISIQKTAIGCDCQNLCSLFSPIFVFVKINLLHSSRAPPGLPV